MYLLDTNIISLVEPRRIARHRTLVLWLRANDPLLFMSVVSVMEIEAGILKLVRNGQGQRAAQLEQFRNGLLTGYSNRIPSVTSEIALETARLADKARPTTLQLDDLLIAATAKVHELAVLTSNVRHFQPTGVSVIDPTHVHLGSSSDEPPAEL